MEQQLPGSLGIVAALAGERVRGDIQADQPGLPVGDVGEGVLDRDLSLPEALDLGALEHEPGLVGVEDLVVVARLAVGCDGLVTHPLRYFMGSTRDPNSAVSKWRWAPVQYPVQPTYPIVSPRPTCWPTDTAIRD